MGAAEIALHIFFRVAAFLMRDDDAAMRTKFGQTARHRFVVAEDAVAMQLHPFGETARDIIERERALHVPRDLHALPRRQVLVDFATRFANLVFHRLDFRIEIEIVLVGMDSSDPEDGAAARKSAFRNQAVGIPCLRAKAVRVPRFFCLTINQ